MDKYSADEPLGQSASVPANLATNATFASTLRCDAPHVPVSTPTGNFANDPSCASKLAEPYPAATSAASSSTVPSPAHRPQSKEEWGKELRGLMPVLRKSLRAIGIPRQVARDAAEHALLQGWRAIRGDFRDRVRQVRPEQMTLMQWLAWLRKVAKHKAFDLRNRERHYSFAQIEQSMSAREDSYPDTDEVALMLNAFWLLSKADRILLGAVYFWRKSRRKLARTIKISNTTLRWRLERAHDRLKAAMWQLREKK